MLAIKYNEGVLIACDMLGVPLSLLPCCIWAHNVPNQGDDDQKLDLIIETSCRCGHIRRAAAVCDYVLTCPSLSPVAHLSHHREQSSIRVIIGAI